VLGPTMVCGLDFSLLFQLTGFHFAVPTTHRWLLLGGSLMGFWFIFGLDSRRILRGSSTGDETGCSDRDHASLTICFQRRVH
jgi:hypothetical protein